MAKQKKKVSVSNGVFGIDFSERTGNDKHIMLDIYIEDDGLWTEKCTLSSSWLNEMIDVLQRTKTKLEGECKKEPNGYGYKFR